MKFRLLIQRLSRDNTGATIIEFAIVAPMFFFLMLCIVEIGLMTFSQIAIESATMSASRTAAIGASNGGCDRACTIKASIQSKTLGLVNGNKVTVEANPLASGGVQSKPEYCLSDPPTTPNADGTCNAPYACNDINGNGKCDPSTGVSVGNAGDMVEIRVTYPWKMLIPFLDRINFFGSQQTRQLYGQNGIVILSASTVIKNEPF